MRDRKNRSPVESVRNSNLLDKFLGFPNTGYMDQLLGLLLLGLGIKTTPFSPPSVMGDETINTATSSSKPPFGRVPPPVKKLPILRNSDAKEASDAKKPKPPIRALKGEFHDEIVTQRSNFMENLKEKQQSFKEEREASKAAFLEKVEKIRDEKKQEILKKLAEKCNEINSNRTEKMTEMLGKLSKILENVTSRAATAAENGKDTSTVDAAVEKAAAAIATAQSAVAERSGIDCTLAIDTEQTLKADVGRAISGLQGELKVVSEQVLAARKAVGDAIKALGLVLGESLTKPKVSPTP